MRADVRIGRPADCGTARVDGGRVAAGDRRTALAERHGPAVGHGGDRGGVGDLVADCGGILGRRERRRGRRGRGEGVGGVFDVGADQCGRAVGGERHGHAEVVAGRPVGRGQGLLPGPACPRAGEDIGRAGERVLPRGADEGGGPVCRDGHRPPEAVAGRAVGCRQLLLLRPGCARAGIDVGRPGGRVAEHGADQRGLAVARERRRAAEVVPGSAVGGGQLLLLRPRAARAGEGIDGSRARVAAGGADQRRLAVSRERRRAAEAVAGRPCGRRQPLLLCPRRPGAGEDIGGALARAASGRADEGGLAIARERRRAAEVVAGGAVGGGQLLLLRPCGARPGEDIGRAGSRAPRIGGDQRGLAVARERRRAAEAVAGRAVGCRQLLLLRPGCARPGEHVHRAGARVAGRRADERGLAVARERHRLAQAVTGDRVGARQLLLLGQSRVDGQRVARSRVGDDDLEPVAAQAQMGGDAPAAGVGHGKAAVCEGVGDGRRRPAGPGLERDRSGGREPCDHAPAGAHDDAKRAGAGRPVGDREALLEPPASASVPHAHGGQVVAYARGRDPHDPGPRRCQPRAADSDGPQAEALTGRAGMQAAVGRHSHGCAPAQPGDGPRPGAHERGRARRDACARHPRPQSRRVVLRRRRRWAAPARWRPAPCPARPPPGAPASAPAERGRCLLTHDPSHCP